MWQLLQDIPPGASRGASFGVLTNSLKPRRISSDNREESSVRSTSGFFGNSHAATIVAVDAISGPLIFIGDDGSGSGLEHAASDAKIVTTSGILPLCTAIDFLTRFSREPNIPADFQLLRQTIGAIMSKRRSLLLASLLAVGVASLHAQTVTKET